MFYNWTSLSTNHVSAFNFFKWQVTRPQPGIISIQEDENTLEMDGGDGCATL